MISYTRHNLKITPNISISGECNIKSNPEQKYALNKLRVPIHMSPSSKNRDSRM